MPNIFLFFNETKTTNDIMTVAPYILGILAITGIIVFITIRRNTK